MPLTHDILKEESSISLLTLNKLLYNVYALIKNTDIAIPTMPYATTSLSGSIKYSDTLNTISTSSNNLLAISPYTLNNDPKILNTYFNNDISINLTNIDNTVSAKYIVLSNKTVLIFGEINILSPNNTLLLNLTELFAQSSDKLSSLLYITIGNGELTNTTSSSSIIKSIIQEADITVSITGNLKFLDNSNISRKLNWFAIGKVE